MKLNNIYVADFETVTVNTNFYRENQDTKVLLWGLKRLDGSFYKRGVDIESFILTIKEINKNITIYFHNLSFDGDFILKYLAKKYQIENDKCNKHSYISIHRQSSVIYSIDWYFTQKINRASYKKSITFKCSYRLLNSSIEQLGKSYNIAKHYENENSTFYDIEPEDDISKYPPRFIEYLDNDIEILRLALIDFNNNIRNLPFIKRYVMLTKREYNPFNAITSASLSLKLIKAFLFTKYFKTSTNINELLYISKKDYNWLKPFYHGGFSQFNEKYLKPRSNVNNALMIDINSAYPYQMSMELPYGDLLDEPPEKSSYTEWYVIKIKKSIIKDKYWNVVTMLNWDGHSIYDSKRKLKVYDRYSREQFDTICYYNKKEWNLMLKMYDIEYEIIEIKYQKTKTFLKSYIEQLFSLKKHYKETGEKGFLLCIKIILNAGYGVFGKRLKYDNYIYSKNENELPEKYKIKHECKNLFIDDYKCYAAENTDEEEKEMVLNVSMAAYITMKERVYLIKQIINVWNPSNKFALCDTDSILYVNLDDDEYELIKNSCNSELGGWNIELDKSKINKLSIFGSKKYALEYDNKLHKFRFAGINNKEYIGKPKLDDWENDAILVKDATLQVKRVKSGIVLVPIEKTLWKGKL